MYKCLRKGWLNLTNKHHAIGRWPSHNSNVNTNYMNIHTMHAELWIRNMNWLTIELWNPNCCFDSRYSNMIQLKCTLLWSIYKLKGSLKKILNLIGPKRKTCLFFLSFPLNTKKQNKKTPNFVGSISIV